MGVVLRRFQLLRKCGFLLAEILFRYLARTQIALKLGLGRFEFADLPRLSGKLPPKIRYHLVALRELCLGDHAVMTGIAQLFFKSGLSRTGLLLAWLWLEALDDVSRST